MQILTWLKVLRNESLNCVLFNARNANLNFRIHLSDEKSETRAQNQAQIARYKLRKFVLVNGKQLVSTFLSRTQDSSSPRTPGADPASSKEHERRTAIANPQWSFSSTQTRDQTCQLRQQALAKRPLRFGRNPNNIVHRNIDMTVADADKEPESSIRSAILPPLIFFPDPNFTADHSCTLLDAISNCLVTPQHKLETLIAGASTKSPRQANLTRLV